MWTLFNHKSCSRYNHLKGKFIFVFNCQVQWKWLISNMHSDVEKITSTKENTSTVFLPQGQTHLWIHAVIISIMMTLLSDVCIYIISLNKIETQTAKTSFLSLFSHFVMTFSIKKLVFMIRYCSSGVINFSLMSNFTCKSPWQQSPNLNSKVFARAFQSATLVTNTDHDKDLITT